MLCVVPTVGMLLYPWLFRGLAKDRVVDLDLGIHPLPSLALDIQIIDSSAVLESSY